jgi:hypothetical protein
METGTPPGWPSGLCSPENPEFPQRCVAWLLDVGPPEFRSHEVFRRHPLVLVHVTAAHVSASLAGFRAAYSAARRDLADWAGPETIEATLRALEREGARLAALTREVDLVGEALRGATWRPRL